MNAFLDCKPPFCILKFPVPLHSIVTSFIALLDLEDILISLLLASVNYKVNFKKFIIVSLWNQYYGSMPQSLQQTR